MLLYQGQPINMARLQVFATIEVRCQFFGEGVVLPKRGCRMYLFKEDIGQISIRHSNQPRMHCLDS